MSIPLRKIIQETREFFEAHDQVTTFRYGEFLDIIKEEEIKYTLAHLNVRNGSVNDLVNTFQLEVTIMDKTFDDNRNIDFVESNTHQIWVDFYNVIRNSPRWQCIGTVISQANPQKFRHKGADVVTGWGGIISFEIYQDSGYCDIPALSYDYECTDDVVPEPTCEDATYQNSDESFTQSIASGSTFVAPDITVTDSDGSTFTAPANTNVTCTPPVNNTTIKGVFSSGVLDMPQITIDSDNEGTYTSESTDGSSGSITYSINAGPYVSFSSPFVLTIGDTLDVSRTDSTSDGFYKIEGTY